MLLSYMENSIVKVT